MSETESVAAPPELGGDLQRLVLERSHDLITVMDPLGTIVYASPSWGVLLGRRPESVVGRPILELIHPDDHKLAAPAIAQVLAGGVLDSVTVRLERADGTWLHAESTGDAIRAADGSVAYLVGTARDVTEREEMRARLRELDALNRVADATAQASGLDELLDEAAETLLAATDADRTAVLLLDEGGTMRFRAWRGLSDSYRERTEGHSPWPPEAVQPEPVLVDDVDGAGFDPEIERAVREEGIGALAFVPLVHGRLVGKFMLYRDEPHVWGEREVRVCLTIANHLASATVRTYARAEVRKSREQLEAIMRTVSEGIVVQTTEAGFVYANDAAARVMGFDSAVEFLTVDRLEVLERFEILDEDGRLANWDELPGRRALGGEPAEALLRYRTRGETEERWSLVRGAPIFGDDGAVEMAVSVMHDVTDMRTAVEEARQAAALLNGVYGAAPVGLAFWDTELRYTRVNEALLEMNGLSREELLGRRIFEVFPGLEERLGPAFRRVLETGEPVLRVETAETTPTNPSAARVWLSSFYPVRDADDRLLGVGGVTSEITAQRRSEERGRFLARASELLNETLAYEHTLGALADLAVPWFAGHVTVDLYEDGALRCVGARHVDPAKTDLMIRLRDEYPPTVDEHPVQRALRTGLPQFVPDVQAEASSMAHDEVHASAIAELENTSGIVVPLIARDRTFGAITFGTVPPQQPFTESDLELAVELGRRASAALDNALLYHETQARAHAAEALEFVDDGVFLLDREGIVRLWNPAAAKTFRVKPAKAVGRHISDVVAAWDMIRDRIRVAPEPTAGVRRAETLPVDVKGEERWLSLAAVRFAGGTVYAFRDMTEERAVDQLKSDFVSTVSHELRTPLAAIYGAALTLQRNDVRLEESQRTGLLDVISSEADRLARIVNDILWASRLDSGLMGIAIERCDAAKLADQVVEALRAHASDRVELEVRATEGLPPVAADPDKLRQVLTNLVDNGVKYSPDGGRVRVGITQAGNRIRFRIEDQGLGIPPAEHGRIFEKFYRLDPNLTRGVGGTGLGLYICRELVDRMEGRIWVASDGRRGSTFTVELPVAA